MEVMTIFTRFPNKQIFENLMVPYKNLDGEIYLDNVDIIGKIFEEPTFNEDGEIIVEAVEKEGFHVNFLNTIPSNFTKYIIPRPATPSRVFAGDNPLLEI